MADDRQSILDDLQAQIDAGPPTNPTRNINTDVHQGYAAQRPFATLEDRLAAPQRAWRSYEELAAALKAAAANLPDKDAPGYAIEQDAEGRWVRYVPVLADTEYDGVTGRAVTHYYEDAPRFVALTRADARDMTRRGAGPADWFDGFTWWRNGEKPERYAFEAQHQAERRNMRAVPARAAAGSGGQRRAAAAKKED